MKKLITLLLACILFCFPVFAESGESSVPSAKPENALLGIALEMADQIREDVSRGTVSFYTGDAELAAAAAETSEAISPEKLVTARCITWTVDVDAYRADEIWLNELEKSIVSILVSQQNAQLGINAITISAFLRKADVYPLPAGISGNSAVLLTYEDGTCLMATFCATENGTLAVDVQPYRTADCLFAEDLDNDSLPETSDFTFPSEDLPLELTIHMSKLSVKEAVHPADMIPAGGEKVTPDDDFLYAEAQKLASRIGEKAASDQYLSDLVGLPASTYYQAEPFKLLKESPDEGRFVFDGDVVKNWIQLISGDVLADGVSSAFGEDEFAARIMNSLPSILNGQFFGTDVLAATTQLTAGSSWLCDEEYTGMYWLVYRTLNDCRICSVAFSTNSHGVLTAYAAPIPGTDTMGDILNAMEKGDKSVLSEDIISSADWLLSLLMEGTYVR